MRYRLDDKTIALLFEVLAQVQREARPTKAVTLSQADRVRLEGAARDPKVVNLWESTRSKQIKTRR